MFPKVERLHMSSMITRGRERPYGLDYDVTDTPATSFVQPPRHHCCGRFNTYVLSCDAIHRSFPGLLLRVAVTSNMLTYNFEWVPLTCQMYVQLVGECPQSHTFLKIV